MKSLKLFLIVLIVGLFAGCSGMSEAVKGFAGVSTKVLEDNRNSAIKKEFAYDLLTAHVKIREILRGYKYTTEGTDEGATVSHSQVYIYSDDLRNDLIACYLSETDTTPVGIFLTESSKNKTLVEVSSPSIYAKEFVAKFLFAGLTDSLKPKKEKAKEKGAN